MNKKIVRRWYSSRSVRAQEFLEFHETTSNGFCLDSRLVPSKFDGYIQLSSHGANKFCVLGEMLAWARGIYITKGQQISHRCHNPVCTIPAHIVVESARENNNRKGCVVWWDCPHSKDGCNLKLLICAHRPTCIRYVPGYSSWEEFCEIGIHQ